MGEYLPPTYENDTPENHFFLISCFFEREHPTAILPVQCSFDIPCSLYTHPSLITLSRGLRGLEHSAAHDARFTKPRKRFGCQNTHKAGGGNDGQLGLLILAQDLENPRVVTASQCQSLSCFFFRAGTIYSLTATPDEILHSDRRVDYESSRVDIIAYAFGRGFLLNKNE